MPAAALRFTSELRHIDKQYHTIRDFDMMMILAIAIDIRLMPLLSGVALFGFIRH